MKGIAETEIATRNIYETISTDTSFKTFMKLIRIAGLEKMLQGEGPLTVFAPTDQAFGKLPKDTMKLLLGRPSELAQVMTYHMVSGKLTLGDILNMGSADTLQGKKVAFDSCSALLVNDAQFVKADIDCSNGVVHGIDAVLVPAR